ncbi:MAG: PLP-dependent aminotransferase family protein [Terriglobia bacterium]
MISLDPNRHEPLYIQIRDQIREQIEAGTLRPGDRLAPSRELARGLGVHRTTVGNAYADLEALGLIRGDVGRGTYVLSSAPKGAPDRRPAGPQFYWESLFTKAPQDDSLPRLLASALEPGVISFAVTHGPLDPDLGEMVRRVANTVLRREGARLLQYGSSEGYAPLKTYLQEMLRHDGIAAATDEILITNGCQQSLDLLRRALVEPGDVVACENPTYTGLSSVFNAPTGRLAGIPIGAAGMDLDRLVSLLERHGLKLILVSPNFQNPTGRTLPLEARKRLLEIANRFQVPLVEDDIYGALRFQGPPLPPLKSLDRTGLVVHLNSFSKVGFPGLRVGWVVGSRALIERLRLAKQQADLHTNMLGQAVIEELGKRGLLEKIMRKARTIYAQKLDVLRAAAQQSFPQGVECFYPEGGMSVWVTLPSGLNSMELLTKARDSGVIFAPSRYFYFQEPQDNALRLCFSALNTDEITKGIRILGKILRDEIRRGVSVTKTNGVAVGMALV